MSPPALSVRRWGKGEPVLFLHGLGASGRYWDRLAAVAGGFEGVAPDLLGFGRSPKPAASSYSVDDHLDALVPLLEAPSVVVGHSTGAILAAALAARERERVIGLLLVGLPAFGDEATARAHIGRLGILARLTVAGSDVARLVCQAMCLLRPLAVTLGPVVIRDLPAEVAADGARHTWPSYSRTLDRVVVGHRPLPDLVDAGVPTVVAHGRADRVAPVALAEALVAAARQRGAPAELRLLEGDHHLAVRRPAVVASVLRQLRLRSGSGDGESGPSSG